MAQKEDKPMKVTDIEAAKMNIETMVNAFARRWMPWEEFDIGVEIMDVGQLRDAMGLRATIDLGDPWPEAERLLLDMGFCWQWLSGQRVMLLKEKAGYQPETGWQDAEEYDDG